MQTRIAPVELRVEAADVTGNESLRRFLNLRADAFLSNDYYASDVAWMDLNTPLDITIGPSETYMDFRGREQSGRRSNQATPGRPLVRNVAALLAARATLRARPAESLPR
jgi:hypothetical protein